MSKVYAPNKNYTGISAGVTFVNGVGETGNKHVLEWFKSKGYSVGEEIKDEALSEGDPETDGSPITEEAEEIEKPDTKFTKEELEKMNREQLMKIADEKKLNVAHNIGDGKLIEKILETQK